MDNDFFLDAAGIPPLLHFDQPPMPTWHSLPPTDLHFPAPPNSDGPPACFFDSMVSSSASTNGFEVRELIGKLGNISSPANAPVAGVSSPYVSPSNSCYSTPLSSPPKMSFPGNSIGSNLPAMPGDPGFADRAARFSSFRSRSFNCRTTTQSVSGFTSNGLTQLKPGRKLQRVLSSPSLKVVENGENEMKVNGFSGNCGVDQGKFGNSRENSSVSEQTHPGCETGSKAGNASKKRKSAPKGKSDQIPSSPSQNGNKKEGDNKTMDDENPPKDYIHVRARRGQATDSHSLAERVRREKIGERMKLLQDIVPGCNKVTGKALMLEEIINYVQSLQRQVEFLSMKLACTPPSLDFNTSNPFQNDIYQPNCSLQTTSSMQQLAATLYGVQNPLHQNGISGLHQSHDIQLPTTDHGFINGLPELQSLCEGDLHRIVEMGYSDNTIYTG